MRRLVSPGLAAYFEIVKFPDNPRGRSHRSALPPTPQIELSILLKALHSFPVGAGPGPDGLRDFLKGLVGHSLESPLLPILQQFLQILADADVPAALQPWLAGGTLVGIGKVDKEGKPVPLIQDARPIVTGHVFRKLVFKCTFRLDAATIRDRLLPQQVAVGVSGGAEAMVHAAIGGSPRLSSSRKILRMLLTKYFLIIFWMNAVGTLRPRLGLLNGIMELLPI